MLFYSSKPAKLDRQQRHLSVLTELVARVEHIKGADNIVADCLSRPACSVSVDVWDLPALAAAQAEDKETQAALSRLQPFTVSGDHQLYCDTSHTMPRPFVPVSHRQTVFHHLHNISHPGVHGSIVLLKQRYFWPTLERDVKTWVRSCLCCQQAKVHRHTKPPPTPFVGSAGRFETVHIDLVGPLPPQSMPGHPFANPMRFVLTCVDRASRWVEACPLAEITAEAVARAFVETWVSRFGVPLYIVSDRGAQFEADLFRCLAAAIGFHRLRTAAYRPQANGMVERRHRVLKTSIMARRQDWLSALPVVLLGIRMLPTETGTSPFSAVTGTELLCPRVTVESTSSANIQHQFVRDLARRMSEIDFRRLSAGSAHGETASYVPKELDACTHVWVRVDRVRHSLEAPYQGPFRVVHRTPRVFTIELPSGGTDTVSVARLKPATLSVSPPPALPAAPDVSAATPQRSAPASSADPAVARPAPDSTEAEPSVRTRRGRTVRFRRKPDFLYF